MKSFVVSCPYPYGARVIMTTVEATLQRGLPEFRIVGLPDRSMREAVVRVKAAIVSAGLSFPLGKVLVNVGPATVPKQGTEFDLSIALAILGASNGLSNSFSAFGELTLKGDVLVSRYSAPPDRDWIANTRSARGKGVQVSHLSAAWKVAKSGKFESFALGVSPEQTPSHFLIDEIQGNALAKRALLIALAGNHHLLISGPPGSGKTLLAESAIQLGYLDPKFIETLSVLEAQAPTQRAYGSIPYHAPHHSVSASSLLGKARPIQPGLISLCTGGVLFLDELPHMQRAVLHSLKVPMQSGVITLGLNDYATLPANCVVIGARTLCSCGRKGLAGEICTCSAGELAAFEKKLSGDLLDRFALHVDMHYRHEASTKVGDEYRRIIAQVHQQKMTENWEVQAEEFLMKCFDTLPLSYRGQEQVRRVSQTIATLEECDSVKIAHVQEAIQYRVRKV